MGWGQASGPPGRPAAASPAERRPRTAVDLSGAVTAQMRHLLHGVARSARDDGQEAKLKVEQLLQEVERLLREFEGEGRKNLLRLLVSDLPRLQKEPAHPVSQLLRQQLEEVQHSADFISALCTAVPSPPEGVAIGEVVSGLCNSSLLSPAVQIAACMALCHSPDAGVAGEARIQLESKLEAASAEEVGAIPEALLMHLLHTTSYHHDDAVEWHAPLEGMRTRLVVGTQSMAAQEERLLRAAADLQSELSLAGVMEELGPSCLGTPSAFDVVLSQCGSINERSIGRASGMLAVYNCGSAGPEDVADSSDLMTLCTALSNVGDESAAAAEGVAASLSESPDARRGWSSDMCPTFVSCVLKRGAQTNWRKVLRELDFSGFHVTDFKGFKIVEQLNKEACQRSAGQSEVLPVECFIDDSWRHHEAQLALLSLCINAPPTVVSFKTARLVPQAQPGGRGGVEVTPDDVWQSVDTVETLLNLASYPELAERVVALFGGAHGGTRSAPLLKCPDLLLLALVMAKPHTQWLRRELIKRALINLVLQSQRDKDRRAGPVLALVAAEAKSLFLAATSEAFVEIGVQFTNALVAVAADAQAVLALVLHSSTDPHLVAALSLAVGRRGVSQGPGSADWIAQVFRHEASIAAELRPTCHNLLSALQAETSPSTAVQYARAIAEARSSCIGQAEQSDAQQLAASFAGDAKPPVDPSMQQAEAQEPSQFPQAIEQEANGYFARIYAEKLDVEQLIAQLISWRDSPEERQRLVHFCMIHNLFDEFRFFHKYPAKELRVTADLFGGIVACKVLSNGRLATALKFVLQNLAKPTHDNLRNFSTWALEKFKHRLPEWPQYCQLLKKIQNLEQMLPGITPYLDGQPPVRNAVATPVPQVGTGTPTMVFQHDITTLMQQPRAGVISPDRHICDRITYLVNNLDAANVEPAVQELLKILSIDHFPYFAEYLVVKRASLEPSFHKLYIRLLELLKSKELDSAVLHATYSSIKALLASDKIRTNSSERSLLKNLGSWLGLQTIARNWPLLARDLDMKGLIFEAMDSGRLIAVAPFAAKVLEHASGSKVFRPPNPWLMGILGLLVDLYHLPDLKLTLRFEVEVLCKNLNLSIGDLVDSKGNRQSQRQRLEDIRQSLDLVHSTDFHPAVPPDQKTPTPSTPAGPVVQAEGMVNFVEQDSRDWPAQQQTACPPIQGTKAEDARWAAGLRSQASAPPPQSQSPLLPHQQTGWLKESDRKAPEWPRPGYAERGSERKDRSDGYRAESVLETVVVPQQLLQHQPRLKQHVAHALEKALGELIHAVVDRSAMIACTATRELVVKDFASEGDDQKMCRAAKLMVRSLASQLAMVTCKDVLRVTMRNHLKAVLTANGCGPDTPAGAAEVQEQLVKDNLNVGVTVVEKAATEEAAKQMDAALVPHLEERERLRERGVWAANGSNDICAELLPPEQRANWRFVRNLPEPLRPRSGLLYTQKHVYDDFGRLPLHGPGSQSPAPTPGPAVAAGTAQREGGAQHQAAAAAQQPHQQGPQSPVVPSSIARTPAQSEQEQELNRVLQSIQDEAVKHYLYSPPRPDQRQVLSLTHSHFTTETQSVHHDQIKKLLSGLPSMIKDEATAVFFAKQIFARHIQLSEHIAQEKNQQNMLAMTLVNEVCLFILQTARERALRPVIEELTRLFCSHERRWHNKEVAVNMIRLRFIDVQEFDMCLMKALQSPDGSPPRQIVEFAGSIVQRCLVDEKLTSQKDLRRTLDALERIAKLARGGSRRQAQQQPPPQGGQQPAQPARPDAPQAEAQSPVAQPPTAEGAREKPEGTASSRSASLKGSPVTPVTPEAAAAAPDAAKPRAPEPDDTLLVLRPSSVRVPSLVTNSRGGQETRDKVFQLFQEWVGIFSRKMQGPPDSQQQQSPHQQQMHFVAKLQTAGLLKADFMLDKFFALLMEISVEDYSSEFARQPPTSGQGGDSTALFLCVDAFSDLIVLLIKCCAWGSSVDAKEKEESKSAVAELALVSKVLGVLSKVLVANHDFHFKPSEHQHFVATLPQGQVAQPAFLQQPYFRFLSNLLVSLSNDTFGGGEDSNHNEVLFLFASTLCTLTPSRLPGFAFAWLELATHRMFMPKLLHPKRSDGWQHFHRILVNLLRFLEPHLSTGELTEPLRLLYKGSLKVFLVLLHDFPEFLAAYHSSLTDLIPITCVQMRNVVLSSFPRDMKLPDPFTPHLKVDRLPEITQEPTILSDHLRVLTPQPKQSRQPLVTKDEITQYVRWRIPSEFPSALVQKLRQQSNPAMLVSVMNSLVLHTGITCIEQLSTEGQPALVQCPAMALFSTLAQGLDPVGRYHFLNAIANQLRFPNSHTHFFSCVLLHLFMADIPQEHGPDHKERQEQVQEQITRVLLERLIVNRPHPWGLLITFIELVKNPRYAFWKKNFIHCAPEVTRLFDSVGQSCAPPGSQQLTQQQQPPQPQQPQPK
eukprot:TRINITY_DN684_c5_g1_i1.p1 TRINITY_DN684_c5_g1~~TRINITY_DN684_c5_g1_i1.p1  ORF type:complete len:2450 (+),score=1075.99 TRINITY_DN684_c5_g1_i1:212-7561(+)